MKIETKRLSLHQKPPFESVMQLMRSKNIQGLVGRE